MLEEDKICDNCLECNICDLKPDKICDNCAKCINDDAPYRAIEIDDIFTNEDLKRKFQLKFKMTDGKIRDYKKSRG
jgi:hypothetical protein